jgi:hypothetical protein
MWLIQHGTPFDVAFSLDPTTRMAMAIIVSEQQSNREYDWGRREFTERT